MKDQHQSRNVSVVRMNPIAEPLPPFSPYNTIALKWGFEQQAG
jgi:hypothetical protein